MDATDPQTEHWGTFTLVIEPDGRQICITENGVLRRTIGDRTHRLSLQPRVLSEAADWMDRKRACGGAYSTSSTST